MRARLGMSALVMIGWVLSPQIPSLAAEDVVYKEEPVKQSAVPPTGQVVAFDPQSLTPFFPTGPLAQAVLRLRIGDGAGAHAALAQGTQAGTPAPALTELTSDVRARFLLAISTLRAAQALSATRPSDSETLAKQAAEHLEALGKSYPLLASYHHLYAAQARLVAGQHPQAIEQASAVAADSVLDCEARFLIGESRRLSARDDAQKTQAVGAYRSFTAACPHSRSREASLRQAQLLDQLGRSAEALVIWRRLYIEAPHEEYGALAEKRLEVPLPSSGTPKAAPGSPSSRGQTTPFSTAELLSRAGTLFEQMRNAESEAAYRWALEQPDLDDAQRCVGRYQLAQSVFKQRQRKRSAPLFEEAATACGPAAAKNIDLHMKSLYQAGRGFGNGGEFQKAADRYALAEATYPGHSYADDARLRHAEMYAELSDQLKKDGPQKTCGQASCPDYEAKRTALLADLPDRYPSGDKRAEALFRLALRSLQKKDWAAAQGWLSRSLAKIPHETGWDQEGRTLYWLGRMAERQGDPAAALAHYSRAVREYPLSYYTLISLLRIKNSAEVELTKLLAELAPQSVGDDAPFVFQPRALFSQPAFLRGVELLRLGLGSDAKREFQSIGLAVPDEKSPLSVSAEREDLLWLSAILFDRAGAFHLSHFVPRHVLTGWQRHYPIGPWRKHWLLAFPTGFRDLVAQNAAESGYPELLQLAIIREESAFDPRTESFANAVGLTQMIQPTARRFSGGLPFDGLSLRDPAINIAIGGRFLAMLCKLWQDNVGLAVPSYNAGEAAVVRWLKATGTDLAELDLFVESIPYDETRGYTKRVLSSYLTYVWLYGTAPAATTHAPALPFPVIPLHLPAPPALR